MRPLRALLIALALLFSGLPACANVESPQIVNVSDLRIAELWRAAATFDRVRYGFTPLPTSGTVGWEVNGSGGGYDAMLHSQAQPYRTIAFKRSNGVFRWIGEQQIFQGPGEYRTVDGTEREHVTITYEIEPVSGVPLFTLWIRYTGPEDGLMTPGGNLTLSQVRPLLRRWGY